MPPVFSLPGLTNPDPARRLLRRGLVQRVDICGINNSEGAFGGHGYDHATQRILQRYAGFYGTGLFSAMQSDGGSAGSGDGFGLPSAADRAQSSVSGGLVTTGRAALASTPAALLANFNQTNTPLTASSAIGYASMEVLHVASGATESGFSGISLGGSNPVIPFADAFTYSVWRGEWGASGGSGTMQPYVRRDESPFTNLGNAAVQPSNSGTLGNMVRCDVNVAADAGRAGWGAIAAYIVNGGGSRTITGPAFATFQRITRTNVQHGFARTALYSAGSRTAMSMWQWATLMPSTSWQHAFNAMCELQGSLSTQCLLVELEEGTNQTGESRFAVGAPNQSVADAPENFAFFMRGICAKIRAEWAASGRSPNNLAFIVSATHGTTVGNNAELVTYRAALASSFDFAGVDRDVTLADREQLRPQSVMTTDGDFADTVHLTQIGYERCQAALYHALLHEPQRRTVNQRGKPALYVWERNTSGFWWATHPGVAQIGRPASPFIVPSDTAAQAAAKITASFTPTVLKGVDQQWAFFAQNLLDGRFGPMGPQSLGLDPIPSSTVVPAQASGFIANGIPRSIAWVREVMLLVRADLRTRGIPEPSWYIDDDEETVSFGSTVAPLVGPGNWWSAGAAAAQASEPSNAILPFRRANQADADRIADGITIDNAQGEFAAVNKPIHNWLKQYQRTGFVKHLCLYQVLREIFPNIRIASYAESAANPPMQSGYAAWASESGGTIYADVHSPVLYPQNTGDTDHATQIGSLGGRNYYMSKMREARARIAAGPQGRVRCAPWMLVPGEALTYPGAPSASYIPTVNDQADLIREFYTTYGDREFLMWCQTMSASVGRQLDELAARVSWLGDGVRSSRIGPR